MSKLHYSPGDLIYNPNASLYFYSFTDSVAINLNPPSWALNHVLAHEILIETEEL